MNAPAPQIPRSVLFRAPGQPVSPRRRREVHTTVVEVVCELATEHGFTVAAAADGRTLRFEREETTLAHLGDLAEAGLKRAASRLSANLIGGPNVTRLDRVIDASHPRLPYRRVVRVVNGRGWNLALGEALPPAALATLIRFCALLPVQILYLPGQPRPRALVDQEQGLAYALPYAGETLRGEIRSGGERGRALARLDVDRFLQFLLGLEAVDQVHEEPPDPI